MGRRVRLTRRLPSAVGNADFAPGDGHEGFPREVLMLRVTIMCLLAAGAAAGCANLQTSSMAAGYCSTGSDRSCPELQGDGDCQPCPTRAVKSSERRLSSNTLEQSLP
jgi:hypothetical protein